jgi:hypothetical protein
VPIVVRAWQCINCLGGVLGGPVCESRQRLVHSPYRRFGDTPVVVTHCVPSPVRRSPFRSPSAVACPPRRPLSSRPPLVLCPASGRSPFLCLPCVTMPWGARRTDPPDRTKAHTGDDGWAGSHRWVAGVSARGSPRTGVMGEPSLATHDLGVVNLPAETAANGRAHP